MSLYTDIKFWVERARGYLCSFPAECRYTATDTTLEAQEERK